MTATPTAIPGRPAAPPPRRWSAPRTISVVLGCLTALFGLGVLASSAFAFGIDRERDDGYLTTSSELFATDSYALTTESLDVNGTGPDALYEQDALGTIRVDGTSANDGTALFLGIGPTNEVRTYLADVSHDLITDFDVDPFRATYAAQPGGAPDETPATQDFWVASDEGNGPRSVTWDVSSGDWSVVVMNADGSPNVQADLSVGATLPVVRTIANVLLVVGIVLLVIGAALVIVPIVASKRGVEARP